MLVNLLIAAAIAVSLPVLVLGIECLLSVLPLRKERRAERGSRPRLAVLVPAHNEEAGISRCLDAILPQLDRDDRLIVIADNCEDGTASIARDFGATVLERVDHQRRGKGYAIRHALGHLESDPPEVVITIDADCLPLPGCAERIARASNATGNPIQAAYLMPPPENASAGTLVSSFAVLVKNYVRPRGLQRLGLPCLITGSGVAYPWELLQSVPHPQSHIVEDMHYSVDLAVAGHPPLPCMEALVESPLPDARQAAHTQRTRWEHGHLSVMLGQGPRLFWAGLRKCSPRLLAMWLEVMVPPLSLLLFGMCVASVVLALSGLLTASWMPLGILWAASAVGGAGLLVGWWRFGRRTLPATKLITVPMYVLGKLPIYKKFVTAPEKSWVRTARDSASMPTGVAPEPHFTTPHSAPRKTTRVD